MEDGLQMCICFFPTAELMHCFPVLFCLIYRIPSTARSFSLANEPKTIPFIPKRGSSNIHSVDFSPPFVIYHIFLLINGTFQSLVCTFVCKELHISSFVQHAVIFLSFWAEVHYNSIYPQGGNYFTPSIVNLKFPDVIIS